jgi:acetylglutamate synthase
VVEPDAQGEGIGNDLWQAISRDFPKFFWRARRDNPIISWYYSVSDGMTKSGTWCVLWRGIEVSRIPEVVENALGRASDFVEVPPGK